MKIMEIKNRYFFSLLAFIFSISQLTQCTKDDKSSEKSKEASIISFELGTYKGKLNGTSLSLLIELPYGTDISSLSAKVKLSSKATIKPDPTTVKDWNNPVSFTVTAENGKDSKKYTVKVKILPPVLTFEKLTKEYTKGGHLNATEILKHVKGQKAGYTLKEITNLNPNDIVTVNGTAPNLRIEFKQSGVFTASLRLKHNATSDLDVTLSNAAFEIIKRAAPSLTWTKQTKAFSSSGEITNSELLAGITGSGKNGYTLKTVTITNVNGTGARVSGSGRAAKITSYTKVGTLTLTLVLEHHTKEDATIRNAKFEITKANAESLSWTKQKKIYTNGIEITNAELLAGVTGSGKNGYTLKTVNITNANGTGARVSGSGRAAKITSYTKVGTLTLTLVLEHHTKEDATIRNAKFEITKANAESLSWTKQKKIYTNGIEITNAELLAGVTGSGKNGYTLKTVNITNANGTGARVSGTGRAAKITSYNKVGTLTLTLILEHDTKKDVTIANTQFEIYKIFDITGSGVVTIKASVDKNSLITVIIPNTIDGTTVTSIGPLAFRYCSSLTRITIPNSVTSIGMQAFNGCTSLTRITIPNKVTSIEKWVFYACSSLTSITIPNSVTSIGNGAFQYCSSLTRITIPNKVTSIGEWAFIACSKLTNITIPNKVTSIGKWIFKDCSSLMTIKLPDSITAIGDHPFTGCSKLTTIEVPTAKRTAWEANLKKGNTANVVGY